jgi:hypothetical protein
VLRACDDGFMTKKKPKPRDEHIEASVAKTLREIETNTRNLHHWAERVDAHLGGLAQSLIDLRHEVQEQRAYLEARSFPGTLDREDLEARVAYIEKKLGIQSGK